MLGCITNIFESYFSVRTSLALELSLLICLLMMVKIADSGSLCNVNVRLINPLIIDDKSLLSHPHWIRIFSFIASCYAVINVCLLYFLNAVPLPSIM